MPAASPSRPSLDKILLSSPSLLTAPEAGTPPRSWVQLCRTGDFVSSRYGEFSITPDDLAQMAANFAAGRAAIDYDHIANSPQRPLDGVAAGWLQQLEVRAGGTELWGEVEWTKLAAEKIKNREYLFFSPTFSKNYTEPTGKKVGAKLHGGALTNSPFLPEMASVTLGNDAVFGQFALSLPMAMAASPPSPETPAPPRGTDDRTGTRVVFDPSNTEAAPELTDEEKRAVYVVKGQREGTFVKLETEDGTAYGWFPEAALTAAPADAESPLPEEKPKPPSDAPALSASTLTASEKFVEAVSRLTAKGSSYLDAITLASRKDPAGAEAYRACGLGAVFVPTAQRTDDRISLSKPPAGQSFDSLVMAEVELTGVSVKDAIHRVSKRYPTLALNR